VLLLISLLPAIFVAALATDAPQPAASPAADTPAYELKEIGRVHALTPFCQKVIQHADTAIDGTLANDVRIQFTIANLKTVDLDSSLVKKADGTAALLKQFIALQDGAKRAQSEVKQLRAEAETATDPQQKEDLKTFANALGGAIERQRKMADQLGRYITYLDSHATIDDWQKAQYLFDIQYAQTAMNNPFHGDPRDWVPPSLTDAAHGAADEFTEEMPDVNRDEATAAQRAEPAFKSCM
jgi:uncharacterized membrane protein YdfJ with MMPL/SSD domain